MDRRKVERIVRSHRRQQLIWTRESIERIDKILNRAGLETAAALKRVAGTGTLREQYLSELLTDIGRVLDDLKADYGGLMDAHLLGSAQIAADREAVIAGQLFSAEDLQRMTDGLRPEITRDVHINSVGRVSVSFGRVSEAALQAVYLRVYQDGLTLSDRLWRLDAGTRQAIEDKVVQGIAQGESARDLAKDLRTYLTETGQGNARYNSMRLARTEINTAHREGHVQSCLDRNGELKSYISGIGWRLSASHPTADICDVWAGDDPDGLGPGNYLPNSLPGPDHPHGLCFTVSLLKSEPDMQFVAKEPEPDGVSDAERQRYGV